jgi:hypothetical protein
MLVAAGASCSADAGSLGASSSSSGGGGGSSGSLGNGRDASSSDATVSSCLPGDVTGFTPTWHRPAYRVAACSPNDQSSFEALAVCVEGGGLDCLDALGLSATCVQCLGTSDTAVRYGPILLHRGWSELNVPGCLAYAMNDPTGVQCAAAAQAAAACELDACGANCPVSAREPLYVYASCAHRADQGPCAGYARDATCTSALARDAGTEVALCMSADPGDVAAWLAWFCVSAEDAGVEDAGAPIDATSD